MSNKKSIPLIKLDTFIFMIFLALKLSNTPPIGQWSWIWVTCPLWIPLALAVIVVVIALLKKKFNK